LRGVHVDGMDNEKERVERVVAAAAEIEEV
jgi:hypothetical protein